LVIHLQHGTVLFIARLKGDVTRVIAVQHGEQDESGNRMPEIADFQRWIDEFELQIRVEDAVWRAPFHINQPQQPPEVTEHFGGEPGMWLVRPDGYLGFRGGQDAERALVDYAHSVGISAP
jgi:hypothetical protein